MHPVFFVTEPRFGKGFALKKMVHTQGVEKGLTGGEGIEYYIDYRGQPVIGAYQWLPEYRMVMITEVDQAEAYAPIYATGGKILLASLVVILLVLPVAFITARTVTLPLRRLVARTEEIGRGNLDFSVGTSAGDEVGELSRAFDRMAGELRATTVSRDRLIESEEKYRLIIENSHDFIFTLNLQGEFSYVYVSPAFERMLGYKQTELLGRPAVLLLHPDDRANIIKDLVRIIKTGEHYEGLEYRVRHASGEWRWHIASGSGVVNDRGEYISLAGIARDITEQKRAEEALRKLNEELEQRVSERTAQLEQANKELEAFSYSVSHDLRAPLRAINGYTQILLEDYLPELDAEGQRVCSVISQSAKDMGKLIDDLLAFSRAGRFELQLSRVDMAVMAKAVYFELTTPQERERIEFNLKDLPEAVADPTLIRQVWYNLISNAIKFSSRRQRAVINISGGKGEHEIFYSVQDNGAGFDMQYADKLFGVFQRLHSSSEFEGNGVGLAIVQRVIQRHGGRVWALGEIDKGAIFDFTLPAKEEAV